MFNPNLCLTKYVIYLNSNKKICGFCVMFLSELPIYLVGVKTGYFLTRVLVHVMKWCII